MLHIGADGNETWIELDAGGTLTSANSIYANQAIGIYVDANGLTNGYLVSIPGIYDPIRNVGVLVSRTPNTPALSGGNGDDVVNDGIIRTSAPNNSGIRSGTYGVVTNNGSIAVTGPDSAGVVGDAWRLWHFAERRLDRRGRGGRCDPDGRIGHRHHDRK